MPDITTSPTINRMRLETVRRSLTVQSIHPVSPRLLSITFSGDDLVGFHSPSPDDHVKIFFPTPDAEAQGRDYTPRHFDGAANLLTIEFFLHADGVGSEWARQARPGDQLQIGGPRGSTVVSAPGAWWLLIGDETALPSVARRLEEMAAGTQVITLLAVSGAAEEQHFKTAANLTPHWIHRQDNHAADATPFLAALSSLMLPKAPGFIWSPPKPKFPKPFAATSWIRWAPRPNGSKLRPTGRKSPEKSRSHSSDSNKANYLALHHRFHARNAIQRHGHRWIA